MQINKTEYEQVNETLHHEVLPSGLTMYLLSKNDYHKTYGLFSTNYGSIGNEFIPYGEKEKVEVPDGIAHFLEHRLFGKEDGDVFQLFGKQGASANAFASFTKTSYLFSTTDQAEKNLTTLIDFVQAPYFTEKTINGEKGIIGQEIRMCGDDPNWRMFFGILGNLYSTHPLYTDIMDTVESIDKITAQDLYTRYRTFYQPNDMVLLVIGKAKPRKLMKLIRKNQETKNFPPEQEVVRCFPENTREVIKQSALEAVITRGKFVLGIKGLDTLPQEGTELLYYKTAINLLFRMILGSIPRNYLAMYSQGIIDDNFDLELSSGHEFHFAGFGGDTDELEKTAERIKEIILGFVDDPKVLETNLDLLRRKMLGRYFQSLNSIEYIANQFTQGLFDDRALSGLPEAIDSIQMKDVLATRGAFIGEEAFSESYMRPK